MKRKAALIAVIALIIAAAAVLFFARNEEKISVKLAGGEPEERVTVVATLFPQYDFARRIAGDRASVTLLPPPGMESHSYEPSPSDIVHIERARVFLYTGDGMEPWVKRLWAGLEKKKPLLVDVSHGVPLLSAAEEHSRDSAHKRDENGHHDESDPHIWTDPNNAIIMARNILAALVAVDPQNKDFYRENAKEYLAELVSLDHDIKAAVVSAKRREIIIGGRNAMRYFMKRYGITAHSAFESCSAEQEPSVRSMMRLREIMERKSFPAIYYEELQTPRVAQSLAEGSGAKLLLLHSAHNLSKEDFEAGSTYISLMRQNLENLKAGLN